MENINILESYFTQRGMIPEAEDPVTTLWFRKLVNNYMSNYGLIGTVKFQTNGYEVIPLQLTRKFQFPPHVNVYYDIGDGILRMNPSSNFQGLDTQGYGRCVGVVTSDHLVIWNFINSPLTVYYRIHGV